MFEYFPASMAVVAGCIAIVGEVWYNGSILTGRTRPDRLAWWILALTGWLGVGSHLALGGGWSVLVPLVIATGMTVTAILSFLHGAPLVRGGLDRAALATVAIGLLAWCLFGAPLLAMLALIIVDTVAMALNIHKAWQLPGSEARAPWAIAVLADLVNLLAVDPSGHGWILPCYLLVTNMLMLYSIIAATGRPLPQQAVKP
jgi:hypothetical protein